MTAMSKLPDRAKYCIIGAGVHGLSTAYHLAKQLKATHKGSSDDIILLEKTGVAAGASGIACGVVRNNYFQPAMSALVMECIKVWEEHAQRLQFNSVGYMTIAGPGQASGLRQVAERHADVGHPSTFVEGQTQCRDYMRAMFSDWKDSDAAAVLHEHKGGFAHSRQAIEGLGRMVQEEGVRIYSDVEVTGFDLDGNDDTVRTVHTSAGSIDTDVLVVSVGPWIKQVWNMLQLPATIDVRDREGNLHPNRNMWTYWQLQEGEVGLNDDVFKLENGSTPPVLHVDSEEPLFDEDSRQITPGPWGIYFKRHHGNTQGGAVPIGLGTEAEVDPYGPKSPHYTVDEDFVTYWTAGLASSLRRFEGCREKYRHAPSGGIGCFSVDNFPIFDFMRPNAYVIADSNHGFKMVAVGKEVASVLLGKPSKILEPFQFSRFAEGKLHPVSNSPFPWA